jgi:hypothetical protein
MPDVGNSPDALAVLQGMKPEDLAKLLRTSNVSNRSELVQQQLARAHAMQDAPADNYGSPLGAMFGGLAGALKTHQGDVREKQAMGEQDRLMGLLEDPSAAALAFGGSAPGAPAAPGAGGGMPGGEDLSAFVEPLIQHRLGMGGPSAGMVGGMGMPQGMDKRKLLAQLLRSGGAGDLGGLGGMT